MNTKMRFNNLALVAFFTFTFAYLGRSPCFGQSTTYTSRSAFEQAISSMPGTRNDVNFQPPLPPGGTAQGDDVTYFPPLNISGLTFRSGGPLIIRLVSLDDFNRVLNNYDSLTPLMVDMNGPALAFGADFSSFLSPVHNNFLATVTLDNGSVFTFTAPADPNFTFFGFVTAQPFSSMTFSDGGLIGIARLHEEILDNITVVVVPEPGVFGLFVLGTLLLGWRLRRKKS